MSASILFRHTFINRDLPSRPTTYLPPGNLSTLFQDRQGLTRIKPSLGVIFPVATDVTNPCFVLWNPTIAAAGNRNLYVEGTFVFGDATDQMGTVIRGANPANNPTGNVAFYNGAGPVAALSGFIGSPTTSFTNRATTSWTVTLGTAYRIAGATIDGAAGHQNIYGWFSANASPETPIKSLGPFDETNTQAVANGTPGFFAQSSLGSVQKLRAYTLTDANFIAFGDAASGATGVTLECVPRFGIGPYTYDWKKASTANGVYASTGGTTATYTYTGGTVGVLEFFKCVVTDTGNSNATTTTEIVRGLKTKPSIVLGFSGDSYYAREIDGNNNGTYTMGTMADLIGQFLADITSRPVTVVNGAVSGKAASEWTSTYQTGFLSNMTTAMTAAGAGAVGIVSIRFGRNDLVLLGQSVSTAATNIRAIKTAMTAAGYTAVLHDPEFVPIDGAAAIDSGKSLSDTLGGDVNGDFTQFEFIASRMDGQDDQTHPNERLNYAIAFREASRIAAIIDPTTVGSNTVISRGGIGVMGL